MRARTMITLLSLLIALNVPRAEAAPNAVATQTVGCGASGYAMRVPATWYLVAACSPRTTATSDSRLGVHMAVAVEKRGWWSDARSYASILGDARAVGTPQGKPLGSPLQIDGHTFISGTIAVLSSYGGVVFLEIETFTAGRLYKFSATLTVLVGTAATNAVEGAWRSIRIFAPTGATASFVTLGGTIEEWTSALGVHMLSTPDSAAGWDACPDGVTPGLVVTFEDGRATRIDGQPCSGPMRMAVRKAQYLRFMPPGAKLVSTFHTDYDEASVYVSDWIGKQRMQSLDCSHNLVPDGTFTVDLHTGQDTRWHIVLGTCG